MLRYSELRDAAASFVREASQRGPVLVIAAVRSAAEEVARRACGTALMGVQPLTMRELAMHLAEFELTRRGLVPVGRVVREALAACVTAQALERDELQYFKPVARFPGFPKALTNTFEELRLNLSSIDGLGECGDSGADLARLLRAYATELAERGLADYATRVELARDLVETGFCRLDGIAVVTLDVAPRTRSERELLDTVLRQARARLVLRLEDSPRETRTSLDSLQRYLFSSGAVPVREPDESVRIFSASGEALECVEIARQIGSAAEAGVPFDEIAVLLRSPARHQPLVEEVLRRAGVPSYSTAGSMRPDVTGRSFLALLHCAEDRLSASRFAEYLSLGQTPEEEGRATPALWERLLVDAAVMGGPERWAMRLGGLREQLQRRYREEQDEGAKAQAEWQWKALDHLEALALPLIERLASLPGRALWGEWIEALTELAEHALREPDRVVEYLEELAPMAEIGPVSLSEVLLVLSPRLNAFAPEPAGSRYGKVWVGSIEEARGLAFRHVFVPGVNEGLFPRPPAEDPLLLEAQRAALAIDAAPEETELLRTAVACASERLTISFSRLDLLTGRERVPSFYAFAVHRGAGGRETGVREFEVQARSATHTRIGWPAPPDAVDAIDDAEFDLSTLAPLTPGSGQYLKKLPGRAVDALRSRWMRWHKTWTRADGLIIDEIGSQELLPYQLTARAWSPTALQQYARCPYRFALRGIFGLRPVERPIAIERVDPATRGQIYHKVQFELLRDLTARNQLPVTSENLPLALELLEQALQLVARQAEADLAPAIPQIWYAEVDSIRADLRGWLHEASQQSGWTPEFFELSFGLRDPAGRDPRSQPEPVELDGGFRLQGSIDLVERHASGARRVVDHKTGKVPDPRPEMVGKGEVLQPALYALVAEKLLSGDVAAGRLWYATIAQNYTAIDVALNAWTRRRAEQVLHSIEQGMRNGFLPAAPRKDGCKRCEYLPVCGPYEEERVTEKSQPELKELKELRGWR